MTRPEGTSKCKEEGCERGTLTEYCRKHRKERGLQRNGQAAVPGYHEMHVTQSEVTITLDEIIEEVGRHVWDAAVEEAIAKKRETPAPDKPAKKVKAA